MMHVEFPNPFTEAVVIGHDYDTQEYLRQAEHRGNPAFIMSSSEIREFNRCPSRWMSGYKEGGSESTKWGDLIDCLVTNPKRFETDFVVRPATYKDEKGGEKKWNGNANVCKEWLARNEGKTVISPDDKEAANLASIHLFSDKKIAALFEASRKQVCATAEYNDKETGITVPVKCLIDLVPNREDAEYGKSLADFKTAADASLFGWPSVVQKRGYHIQAAWHLDIYTAATGEDRQDFRHIIQENFDPYQTGCRVLGSEFLNLGRATYTAALKRYCQCLASGSWPDYDADASIHLNGWPVVSPSAWMLATS